MDQSNTSIDTIANSEQESTQNRNLIGKGVGVVFGAGLGYIFGNTCVEAYHKMGQVSEVADIANVATPTILAGIVAGYIGNEIQEQISYYMNR